MAEEVSMEQVLQQLNQMKERQDALENENGQLKVQLAGVAGKQLEEKPAEPLKVPTELLEHKGKKYKVRVSGFRKSGKDGGELITAQELIADSDLIDEVLKIEGQGILKLQH